MCGMIAPVLSRCALLTSLLAALGISAVGAVEKTPEKSAAPTASAEKAASSLFDGKTLTGWVSSDFAGRGTVTISNSQINLGMGHMTGITWTNTNSLPRMSYEISLDAMRVEGSDF